MLARCTEIPGRCEAATPQLSSGLISHDAVVIEIPDHGQIQDTLLGVDVRDVRYPFAVGPVCVKFSVQQILIPVDLLPHLLPFSATADF